MVDAARRLTGLLVALVLLASLPVAAARAGCACDHAHGRAAAAPHTCTASCTAATCPMHRGASAAGHQHGAPADGLRCGCASDAQALIAQASPVGILPAASRLAGPLPRCVVLPAASAVVLTSDTTPPAPPPRV